MVDWKTAPFRAVFNLPATVRSILDFVDTSAATKNGHLNG
jgi:hypothetical protein